MWHDKVEKSWDLYAEDWTAESKKMWETGSRKEIIPFFSRHVPREGSVADLGCGDGYGSMMLIREGYKVTGIDISAKMIEAARKRPEASGASFLQGDIADLPFKDGEFDALLVINVLEWTEKPLDTLNEMKRILKEGGCACFGILGPTAAPRKAQRYKRLYGKPVIMNDMLPWEFGQLAGENGWNLLAECPVNKRDGEVEQMRAFPIELRQAVCFMWLFMLQKK